MSFKSPVQDFFSLNLNITFFQNARIVPSFCHSRDLLSIAIAVLTFTLFSKQASLKIRPTENSIDERWGRAIKFLMLYTNKLGRVVYNKQKKLFWVRVLGDHAVF